MDGGILELYSSIAFKLFEICLRSPRIRHYRTPYIFLNVWHWSDHNHPSALANTLSGISSRGSATSFSKNKHWRLSRLCAKKSAIFSLDSKSFVALTCISWIAIGFAISTMPDSISAFDFTSNDISSSNLASICFRFFESCSLENSFEPSKLNSPAL